VFRRIVFALVLAGAAGVALADDASDARQMAADADAVAKGGGYARAAVLFRRAYALDDRPEYQCNAGIAYWKARDLTGAQLYLTMCLDRGSHLDAKLVKSMRAVLDAVEDKLRTGNYGPVDIAATPASAEVYLDVLGDDVAFHGARLVWLPFGVHELRVRAPGYGPEIKSIKVESRTPSKVAITLAPVPDLEPLPPDAGVPVVPVQADAAPEPVYDNGPKTPDAPDPDLDDPPPAAGGFSRRTAIGFTAATGALAVASGVFYLAARSAANDAGALEQDEGYEAAREKAARLRVITYGLYVGTAAAAAVSVYLWTHLAPESPVQVGAGVQGGGAAVWLQGSF
jgi:hypothetical protein